MGYVMQEYQESGEYHIYEAHYDINGQIVVKPTVPLCGDNDVSYDSRYKLTFREIKNEDEMAHICAEQKTSVRHKICAKCVGRFYKTN